MFWNLADGRNRSVTFIAATLAILLESTVAEAEGRSSFETAAAVGTKDLADAAAGCPGTRLTVQPVRFSSSVDGALLHITSSSPTCLGADGEYQSLAVRGADGRWREGFGSGPQTIIMDGIRKSGVTSFLVRSVLGCTATYTWTGRRYVEHRRANGMGACGNGPFPSEIHNIESAIVSTRVDRWAGQR